MSDYRTYTVVQRNIPRAAMTELERLILCEIFEFEEDDDGAYYFYAGDDVAEFVDMSYDALKTAYLASPMIESRATHMVERAFLDAEAERRDEIVPIDVSIDVTWRTILQDIVKRTPLLGHISVEQSYTSTHMDREGFGGSATFITEYSITCIDTADYIADCIEAQRRDGRYFAPPPGRHVAF